jgi:hypothetical protein
VLTEYRYGLPGHICRREDGDGITHCGREVEHEGHFHLLGRSVDDKRLEFVTKGLFHSEVLKTGLVGVVLCRFSHLSGAVGAGVDDHVTFGLSFSDGRPLNRGHRFDQAFLL